VEKAVVIELPPEVAELIKSVAARRGKSVEQLVVEAVVSELDPEARVEAYLKLAEKYLLDAEELYAKGDLAQAGEKYWGAVTALLSVIAERRGMPHYTHRDFWDIVEALVEESGNPEYSTLFRLAEGLHANFYHGFMRRESFEKHREGVLRLINMLMEAAAKGRRAPGASGV